MRSHLWYSFHFWPLTFQCYYNNRLFCLVISTLHKYLTSLAKFLSWKSSLRLSVMPWDHWKLEHRRWVCPLSVLHLIYIRPCTVWQGRIQQPSVLIHSPLGISASLVHYATASAVQTVVDKSAAAAAAVFLSLPRIVKHSVIYCWPAAACSTVLAYWWSRQQLQNLVCCLSCPLSVIQTFLTTHRSSEAAQLITDCLSVIACLSDWLSDLVTSSTGYTDLIRPCLTFANCWLLQQNIWPGRAASDCQQQSENSGELGR